VGRRGTGGKQQNNFLPVLLELCADFVGMNNLDLFGRQGWGEGEERRRRRRGRRRSCLFVCHVGSRRNKLSLSEKFVSAVAAGACGLLLDDMYKRHI
jgi:hypothetical protein